MLPDTATLELLERNFAAAYRAELDQSENVWRSLPFFATALALQLATLFQVVDRLPPAASPTGPTAALLLACSVGATLVALIFLAASIWPARLVTIVSESVLLDHAQAVTRDAFLLHLAAQYAPAAVYNRSVNIRRRRRRAVAGLATVVSLLLTLLLVSVTVLHYMPSRWMG